MQDIYTGTGQADICEINVKQSCKRVCLMEHTAGFLICSVHVIRDGAVYCRLQTVCSACQTSGSGL